MINGYLGDRGLSLRLGTIVGVTLIHAPSSTKNKDGNRDPEMHKTRKGNHYYFGAKAYICAYEESGLVHRVVVTAANVADIRQWSKPQAIFQALAADCCRRVPIDYELFAQVVQEIPAQWFERILSTLGELRRYSTCAAAVPFMRTT